MANTKYAVNRRQMADRKADKHWARLQADKKSRTKPDEKAMKKVDVIRS